MFKHKMSTNRQKSSPNVVRNTKPRLILSLGTVVPDFRDHCLLQDFGAQGCI